MEAFGITTDTKLAATTTGLVETASLIGLIVVFELQLGKEITTKIETMKARLGFGFFQNFFISVGLIRDRSLNVYPDKIISFLV